MDSNRDHIIQETVSRVEDLLGSELEELVVERAVLGLFFSGVKLSSGHGGLSFTPIKEIPEAVCCPSSARAMPESGRLCGKSARAALEDTSSDNVLKRTLGIAALNALSALCWERMKDKTYELELGRDAYDGVDLTVYRRTVVVGALVPIIRKLMAAQADFRILEMDPSTLKPSEMPYFVEAGRADEFVPHADLLVITGTTMLNGTLESLLSMARPETEVIISGPTASMLPEALFARGTSRVGGVVATQPDALLDLISEGGSGYHFFGKLAEKLVIGNPALS
jgi:uncharacterized protein (DUF4213/DUF364 family)